MIQLTDNLTQLMKLKKKYFLASVFSANSLFQGRTVWSIFYYPSAESHWRSSMMFLTAFLPSTFCRGGGGGLGDVFPFWMLSNLYFLLVVRFPSESGWISVAVAFTCFCLPMLRLCVSECTLLIMGTSSCCLQLDFLKEHLSLVSPSPEGRMCGSPSYCPFLSIMCKYTVSYKSLWNS
jgi:hypothetical protein